MSHLRVLVRMRVRCVRNRPQPSAASTRKCSRARGQACIYHSPQPSPASPCSQSFLSPPNKSPANTTHTHAQTHTHTHPTKRDSEEAGRRLSELAAESEQAGSDGDVTLKVKSYCPSKCAYMRARTLHPVRAPHPKRGRDFVIAGRKIDTHPRPHPRTHGVLQHLPEKVSPIPTLRTGCRCARYSADRAARSRHPELPNPFSVLNSGGHPFPNGQWRRRMEIAHSKDLD